MTSANRTPDLLAELVEASNVSHYRLGQINAVHRSVHLALKLNGYDEAQDAEMNAWDAAEAYVGAINEQLPMAKIFYADEHMCEVVEMAAAVMDSSDVADADLVEVDNGFCYFAGGIPVHEHATIHGLAWVRIKDMVLLSTYNDSFVEIDQASIFWRENVEENSGHRITGRWSYGVMSMYRTGEPFAFVPELSSEQLAEKGLSSVLEGASTLTINQIFHALTLLLSQPPQVIELTEEELEHKKQLKRVKAKHISTTTTVIDMRHRYVSKSRSTEDGEEKAFEYTRRWLVSGHWRWQPMKDKETKEWTRKRIWINPHVKGPEDAPFVATKKVYALLK